MTPEKRAELKVLAMEIAYEIARLDMHAENLRTLVLGIGNPGIDRFSAPRADDDASAALLGVAVNAIVPSELIAAIQSFRAREAKP